jgi:nanoRNase/pAp phosphatase (c-di-AMP/oligoRNAs hydrolase)
MPTARIAYVDQPFAQPRVTPDYSRLAALYQSGGAQLASLALQRGQITSSTLDRLGSLFSGFRQAQDQQKAATMALALRREEKKADLDEKAKDRTERADERKEAARLTKETQDRAAAGRLVDDIALVRLRTRRNRA